MRPPGDPPEIVGLDADPEGGNFGQADCRNLNWARVAHPELIGLGDRALP